MRNYWSLLPAIAVIVGLILLYAIPTLINPQWTSSILALFRQFPDASLELAEASAKAAGPKAESRQPVAVGAYAGQPQHAGVPPEQPPADAEPTRAEQAAGVLGPQQIKSRRMLAIFMVCAAVALIGFNVVLNREANGCYEAAKAWGAIDGKADKDPCVNKIYGSFFGDGSGEAFETKQQPVVAYQLVRGKKPTYLRWIQNAPKYDESDLLIGTSMECNLDLKVKEEADRISVLIDSDSPCPPSDDISLTAVKLKKPLGDREIVTVGDKPVKEINPDVDSWPTVLKKLVTGG
ncbi:hypothetical protein [Kribbella antiqua]|uniref:hypothetical protein n=1 Tax=Kribbella antiqua TaxID=2512217 RepID=UPI0018EE5ABA|nr:hypothetical protein [Kribbella antiqua]